MRPVGEWREGKAYGAVVSSAVEDTGYPAADESAVSAYGGHLVAESIAPALRRTIATLPDLLRVCEGFDNIRHELLDSPEVALVLAGLDASCTTPER